MALKNQMKAILYICAILILAQASLALTINYNEEGNIISGPSDLLEVSIASFGNQDQERVDNVGVTVSFENKGTESITLTQITNTLSSGFNFEALNFPASLTINSGESKSISLEADIPLDFDGIDNKGKEKPQNIGFVSYRGTIGSESLVVQTPVLMQARNHIEIEDLKIYLNNALELLQDGEIVEGMSPGDEIRIAVEYTSTFKIDGARTDPDTIIDVEIRDIVFEVDIDHDRFNTKIKDERGDLKSEQDDFSEVKFTLDNDVGSATLPTRIELTGKDQYGALHGFIFDVILKVEQERHDLAIQNIKVAPEKISCEENINFDFMFANIGGDDEDQAKIIIESEALGIEEVIDNINIKEGASRDYKRSIKLPEQRVPGVYIFNLRSFFAERLQVDHKSVDVEIVECDSSSDSHQQTHEESEDQNTLPPPEIVTVETTLNTQNGDTQNTNPSSSTQESNPTNAETSEVLGFGENSILIFWIIITFILIIAIILILIILFLKYR